MKTKIYIGDTIYVGCKCAEAVKVADAPQSETDATPTEEQPTEKPKRHRPQAKPLLPGLREQFIEYFMKKYPITKKIPSARKDATTVSACTTRKKTSVCSTCGRTPMKCSW